MLKKFFLKKNTVIYQKYAYNKLFYCEIVENKRKIVMCFLTILKNSFKLLNTFKLLKTFKLI